MASSKRAAVLAPAKINLTLEILARRDDGYHTLRSVMVPIALSDELAFEPSERFAFACEPAALQDDNLVLRALQGLGLHDAPVALTLRKRVPVGAGLGGGSSDAAAVLRAAMDGRFGAAGEHDWLAAARALGSDVPFFLADGPALVEGTGERVTALGRPPAWWVVLLVPDVHVATGHMYAELAAQRATAAPPVRPRSASPSLRAADALQRGDYDAVLALLDNDFEPLVRARYPEVDETLRALAAADPPGRALLSGSGGACFALFDAEDPARAYAARLRAPARAALHIVPFAGGDVWR